ncbi:hypothetical protein JZU46_01470, partial [bacterium]|nr:hypothetical protein [bacterium]
MRPTHLAHTGALDGRKPQLNRRDIEAAKNLEWRSTAQSFTWGRLTRSELRSPETNRHQGFLNDGKMPPRLTYI